MSRTIKGSKGAGYDYWSRRHPYSCCMSPSKFNKRLTNRYQRRLDKKICRNAIVNT